MHWRAKLFEARSGMTGGTEQMFLSRNHNNYVHIYSWWSFSWMSLAPSSYLPFPIFYRQLLVILIFFLRRIVTTRYVALWILKTALKDEDFFYIFSTLSCLAASFVVENTHVCLVIDWCIVVLKMVFFNESLELFHCRSCFQLVPGVPKRTGNKQFFSWRNQFL